MKKKKVNPPSVFYEGQFNLPLKKVLNNLFEEIKHGDEEHQKWLKEKIDKFYKELTRKPTKDERRIMRALLQRRQLR